MAIDYAVTLECEPKKHFGSGDCAKGALNILDRLKSKNRAAALRQLTDGKGVNEAVVTIRLMIHDREGNPIQREVTLAELEAEAKLLDGHASACNGCRANFLGQAYGCFGAINYPIPESGEAWLLGRVQPAGSLGAQLCAEFMAEFGLKGDPVRRMRDEGLFDARKTGKATLSKKFLRSVSVSADQLLETIFMAGNPLAPGHCFGILIWLGAIRVDGRVPSSPDDQAVIRTLLGLQSPQDKEQHTQLELGPKMTAKGPAEFQLLATALYLCWVCDVPLYISP